MRSTIPELPEVETIKSQLQKTLPMKIKDVTFSDVSESIVKDRDFCPTKGMTLESVIRTGKILRFMFSDNMKMISGLGMSGSWRISNTKITEKHTHVQIEGTHNGKKVFLGYIDPRRFGNIHFLTEEHETEWLKRLGPDVSTTDFDFEYLWGLTKSKPTKTLKPFLLEQNFFAGIGNYMASEICARAFLRPTRKMKTLRKADCEALIESTRSVLNDSIKNNGTTFSGGYADAFGEKGEGVKNLVVFYQKVCGLCKKTEVKKITLGGRGTYYCPRCQK